MKLIADLKESGYETWTKNYSVEKELDAMDRAGVATSFIWLTTAA
jgi:hypothetical protein